jgi:hypothetical protein
MEEDQLLRINPVIQNWAPAVKRLPKEIKEMIELKNKYKIRIDGIALAGNVLREIPIWQHPYRMERLKNATKAGNCLRSNHRVATVGNTVDLIDCFPSPKRFDVPM